MLPPVVNEIAAAIREQRCILFVGAGVSRALNLPSWDELVAKIAARVDFDPEVFRCLGNALSLAEYLKLHGGPYEAFLDELRVEWAKTEAQVKDSPIHRLIAELGFQTIYTTNFDGLIEAGFEVHGFPYHVVRGIQDIPGYREGTLIVKYHGDIQQPKTLVLAESDYFRRLEFNDPLDLKLRHDLLGKSVLFIGYSLSDFNVRYLLFKLAEMWKAAGAARQPSYLFMSEPNPIEQKVLEAWGVTRVSLDHHVAPGEALTAFLTALRKRAEVDIAALKLGKTVAVDFDGVIHQQPHTWAGTDVIDGLLVPQSVECLEHLRALGYVINITSARANCPRGRIAITRWLQKNKVPFDMISSRIGAALYIDDLAVRFEGKWSKTAVEEWLKLESWHGHPHSKTGA